MCTSATMGSTYAMSMVWAMGASLSMSFACAILAWSVLWHRRSCVERLGERGEGAPEARARSRGLGAERSAAGGAQEGAEGAREAGRWGSSGREPRRASARLSAALRRARQSRQPRPMAQGEGVPSQPRAQGRQARRPKSRNQGL